MYNSNCCEDNSVQLSQVKRMEEENENNLGEEEEEY